MGLAKSLKGSLGCFCLVTALASLFGCSNKDSSSVSSEQFLAPQNQEVEALVTRLQINRVVHPGVLDSQLQNIFPILNIVGKLNQDLLLIYNGENNSRDMITIDFKTNSVKKVLTKDELVAIFNQQAQKPVLGPMVELLNGWILGFENQSNSLWAIREFPSGSGEVAANLVLDQASIQDQIFPDQGEGGPPVTKAVVKARHLVEFQPNQVLMVPATTNITALHHLAVEEIQVQDEFGIFRPVLIGEFVLLPPPGLPPDTPLREGFLEYEKIKVKTGNAAVNVIDFQPVVLPDTTKVLLFDRTSDTSSFLTMTYKLELLDPANPQSDLVYRTSVDVLTNRKNLTDAIEEANQGGDPFTGTFDFRSPFLHPGASLAASDPDHRSLVLTFEGVTNNTMSIDWTAPNQADRAGVFSSANQLSARTDLHPQPGVPPGSFDPQLLFARNDVLQNRVVWDQGPGDLLSLSYETGQWVVVAHRADISRQTGSSLVTLNYIEALDDDNLRVVDLESATVLGVHLSYQAIPVSFPR